eukprot:CAMPEP_0172764404 /NCGR_PEP_ID=MMETSP1074-20121228/177186_1 /TAXON_ID=2916 /ORGANISM="Ceratium fusus, Strain PA161109" /LENGTH=93 /DNA_ID=CAMNT_0013599159 /DNA_START=53 /DNA_END=331 /DNA_ORIENTATION=+
MGTNGKGFRSKALRAAAHLSGTAITISVIASYAGHHNGDLSSGRRFAARTSRARSTCTCCFDNSPALRSSSGCGGIRESSAASCCAEGGPSSL